MTRIDFIPLEHHEAGRRRRMVRMRSAGVAALVVVMGLWIGVNRSMIASARAMMPEIESQQRQIDIHLDRTKQMMADRATLDARRAFLDQLHLRISLVPILADISERMPESVLLTRMSFNPDSLGKDEVETKNAETGDPNNVKPKAPPAPPQPPGSAEPPLPAGAAVVAIHGVARTVPDILEFAEALERSKLLSRVEMQIGEPGIWAGKQVQQFEVSCALVPQLRSKK